MNALEMVPNGTLSAGTPSASDLAELPLWVAWKSVPAEAGGPDRKVPINPTTGRPARTNDPETWAPRAMAEARARAEGLDGIGICFAEIGDGRAIAGIDLDTCRDLETGALTDWAAGIVSRFKSYVEISPSGTGAKIFFLLTSEDHNALLAEISSGESQGRKWAAKTGSAHPPAIEIYLGRRFFTLTERPLPGSPEDWKVVDAATVRWLIAQAGPAFEARFSVVNGTDPGPNFGSGSAPPRDNSRSGIAYRKGFAAVQSGANFEKMSAVLRDDPETAEWVREKGENAGGRELRRIFDKARTRAAEPLPEIAKLNEDYAVIMTGDRVSVLREKLSPEGRPTFDLMSPAAFKTWLLPQRLELMKKSVSVANLWLRHPQRRQYEGLIFAPGREVPGFYNLWRGFAVTPRSGDCSRFLTHLKDNVSNGDEGLFQWVVGWFAAIFLRLDRKLGTSLILRGKQGTGKTKVGEVFGSLLGDHYTAISDPRYIYGRFNSHLASCLLLHADEAFWAGDRAAEGRLKDLITGSHHLIEFKGKEPIRFPNYVRLFATGNPDWVVPAGMEERRFAVLDMGENHMQDRDYFAAIDKEMENGGREALLHYLLNFDLTGLDLGKIPKTKALLEQKMETLDPQMAWVLDLLERGDLPDVDRISYDLDFCEVPSEILFKNYIDHAKSGGVTRRAIEVKIGMLLNKLFPDMEVKKKQPYANAMGHIKSGTIYRFPPLKTCRERFVERVDQPIRWTDPEAEWGGVAIMDDPERGIWRDGEGALDF